MLSQILGQAGLTSFRPGMPQFNCKLDRVSATGNDYRNFKTPQAAVTSMNLAPLFLFTH